MPRTPLPAYTVPLESRLRARATTQPSPVDSLPPKVRGLKAAAAVLSGDLSAAEAVKLFQVSPDSLKYYKKRLQDSGWETPASSATPASDVVTSKESECSSFSTAWNEYCLAYIYAGQLVAEHGRHKAAEMATDKFKVYVSPSTARRAAQSPGQPPSRCGAKLIIPAAVEHKLESLCLVLRELNMPVFRFMILNYVNQLIKGTPMAEALKHREVRRNWYYNWLGRCKRLTTANIRPLEMTRAKWATPENVKKHYEMLSDKLIELGFAVRNPGYDPEKPYDEELKIIKPDRIASMDETRLTNDMREKNKSKNCKSIVGKVDDSREFLANKGGGDGTGIGGSTADGIDLPGFFIFSKDIIHVGEQNDDISEDVRPVCRRMDPANPGHPLPCRFWANTNGGVTGDLGVRYIRGCVEPSMPGLSPENPGLLIMDGHGSHFTLELLSYCRSIGLHIILRPPHTTHILQGEDVQHFAVFKSDYHQAKVTTLGTKVISGKYKLTAADLLGCARKAWEKAFNMENTLRAWAKIGVSPFNRKVYWDLVAAKEKRDRIAIAANVRPEDMTVEGMFRMVFPDAAATNGPGPGRERDTLNSSDLWDLPGGATGDDCYRLVKDKVEKRKAKEAATSQRRAKRSANHQERLANTNALGSQVVGALVHDGQIAQLKVPQLQAALTFKGVHVAQNSLKAALVATLSATLKLPAEGPVPAFVLPPAPVARPIANSSAEPVDVGPSHDSDAEGSSGSEDEDDAEIAQVDD